MNYLKCTSVKFCPVSSKQHGKNEVSIASKITRQTHDIRGLTESIERGDSLAQMFPYASGNWDHSIDERGVWLI